MIEETTESSGQEQVSHPNWGGKRSGAGRRPRDVERWIKARGLKPASAAEILERADERAIWYRLLHSEDEAIVLRTITYLTDRRDGRPAQQINVTSVNVQYSAEEVARARQVVRELTGAPTLEGQVSPSKPLGLPSPGF